MARNLIRFFVITCSVIILLAAQQPVQAQDSGKPVMQELTFYSAIGMALGAGLGLAIWMLDPLAPSANFVLSIANGVAVGAIGGTAFGFSILSRQMVVPYRAPAPVYNDDFQSYLTPRNPVHNPEFDYAAALKHKRPSGAPILGFNYKF